MKDLTFIERPVYTGWDKIRDERAAENAPPEDDAYELNKDAVASDLLALAAVFADGHRNKNTILRAVAVLCNRNRIAIAKDIRTTVRERQGERCTYCGDETGPFEFDHIFPVSRGGSNAANNLTLACSVCNSSKRDKTIAEWVAA